MNARALLAAAFIVALASEPHLLAQVPPEKPTAERPDAPAKPITEPEAREFAQLFESAVLAADHQALARLFDWDAFFERTMADTPATPAVKNAFRKGAQDAIDQKGAIVADLVRQPEQEQSIKLLRFHTVDGEPRLLFRAISPDKGSNYQDLVLTRSPEGAIRIADLYAMVTGEMLSTGLKRWYVQAAKVGNAKNPAEAKANSDFLKEQEGVARLGDLGMAAKWPEWLELYRKLPRAIQTEKSVLLVRLRATRELGDEEGYNTALEEFRKLFPQDACIDFLSIDYYLTKGQHQESLACVDRVDRFLGGDPYLDVIRANLLADAGDLKAATLAADKAIAAEPDLFDAVASRLSIALKAKDHAATMRYLLHLEKEFGIEFADLTIVPEYAEFVKSPEHKKWLERPKPKPPAEPDQK